MKRPTPAEAALASQSASFRALNPNLFSRPQPPSNEDHTHSPLPHPVAERHEAPALGATVQGEAQRLQRTGLRFVGYRVRPLDPDNFAGSVKDLLDGLRHAGLIPDDNPERITLQTEQVLVAHLSDEKTVIELDLP